MKRAVLALAMFCVTGTAYAVDTPNCRVTSGGPHSFNLYSDGSNTETIWVQAIILTQNDEGQCAGPPTLIQREAPGVTTGWYNLQLVPVVTNQNSSTWNIVVSAPANPGQTRNGRFEIRYQGVYVNEIGFYQPGNADTDGDGVIDLLDRCPNTPPGTTVDATGCPPQWLLSIRLSDAIAPPSVINNVSLQQRSETNATMSLTTSTGAPVSGVDLRLSVRAHNMIGGGHHHGSDPLFLIPPEVTREDGCTTVSSGQCVITISLPDASGEYAVDVTTTDGRAHSTAFLTVKVEGLGPLPPASYYRLTGTDSPVGMLHTNNHNGTAGLRSDIARLAQAYQIAVLGFVGRIVTLGINDMSLPLGGLFDLNGVYSSHQGHKGHRLGLSVDIDQRHSYADGTLEFVNRQLLEGIADILGLSQELEATIHFQRSR